MSYNISRFKLKSVSLTLPKGFNMRDFSRKAWREIQVATDLQTWDYNWGNEGFQMKGRVTDAGFEVTDLRCSSEGSGNDYYYLLVPLFEKFEGNLEASLVWEGGDSITKNTIKKGVAAEEPIEI